MEGQNYKNQQTGIKRNCTQDMSALFPDDIEGSMWWWSMFQLVYGFGDYEPFQGSRQEALEKAAIISPGIISIF